MCRENALFCSLEGSKENTNCTSMLIRTTMFKEILTANYLVYLVAAWTNNCYTDLEFWVAVWTE